jgi:hypothetical protein
VLIAAGAGGVRPGRHLACPAAGTADDRGRGVEGDLVMGESSAGMQVAELASRAIRRLFGLERESAIKFPVGAVEQH